MKAFKLFILACLAISLAGCADIQPPTPVQIIKRPIGTESVKLGMTQNHVRELWGNPDQVNVVTDKEKWGGDRTEWVYFARSSALPFDAGYLFKTQRLYFDGENLTNIKEGE